MNIGMRAHDLDAQTMNDLGRKLNGLDIRHIQLALLKSVHEVKIQKGSFSPGLAHMVRRALSQQDVHVSVLGCYINPIHPDKTVRQEQVALFCEHLKYAKYLGADMVGTETGSLNGDLSFHPDNHTDKAYTQFMESMGTIVTCAEKLGVMVGIEPVSAFTIHSPELMKQFLDDINSPNVSVIFDPVNLLNGQNYMQQREIMESSFALFGDRIAAVHIKDFTVVGNSRPYALPGEGLLDLGFLFSILKAQKPHIAMLLEGVGEENIIPVREKLRKLYEEA